MDIFFVLALVAGGIVGGVIGWFLTRKDPILEQIISYLVQHHLDEKPFSVERVSQALRLDKAVVERYLMKLERMGVVMKTRRGWELVDPLVFLTKRDYERALRLTAGDNILYGGYQYYKLASWKTLLAFILTFIFLIALPIIFCYYNLFGYQDWVKSTFPGIDPWLFTIFLALMALVLIDVIDNVAKYFTRERYCIVVAQKAGILYDVSLTDEMSGRIPRGAIERVDVDVSPLQYLNNVFGEVPVGDVIVWVRGQPEPLRFRSVPYPRELAMCIRSIQLGHLEWRKRYARELALWKGRVLIAPPVRRRRR